MSYRITAQITQASTGKTLYATEKRGLVLDGMRAMIERLSNACDKLPDDVIMAQDLRFTITAQKDQ